MRHHAFYPTAYRTVEPRHFKVLRALRWLLLSCALVLMACMGAMVIVKLVTIDARLDSAFLQGMTAGAQFCPRGT